MKIENREYKLRDFIKIPLAVSPVLASLLIIDKIIYAMIPALQVLAVGSFVDTAIGIFNGQRGLPQENARRAFYSRRIPGRILNMAC